MWPSDTPGSPDYRPKTAPLLVDLDAPDGLAAARERCPMEPPKDGESADGSSGASVPAESAPARLAAALIPATTPAPARRAFALELYGTLLFSLALACVEGGVVAVLAKQAFRDAVHQRELYLAVAILGAAPEIANILSFFWTQVGYGRPKIALINAQQALVVALVASMALAPPTRAGLWVIVALVMATRVAWSGILTLRPTVWRANYPRHLRATVVARFSTVQVLVVAAMGVLIGRAMDADPSSFRVIVPVAAALALGAVWLYRALPVAGEAEILAVERADPDGPRGIMRPWRGPLVVWRVLRKDRFYAAFMFWMFVLGLGNIMLTPVLVITLRERFHFGYLPSILVVTSIPAAVNALTVPIWARLLDRAHVVHFRSIHGWAFVLAACVLVVACAAQSVTLLFVAAVAQGIAFGGGALAWNLGHVDFAPPAQTSQYMATHVTLNGLRGLIAPFLAVGLYERLRAAPADGWRLMGKSIDATSWADVIVFAVSLAFCVVGTLGFVRLRAQMGALAKAARPRR